jgi:6-hydroxynicotinate reductase
VGDFRQYSFVYKRYAQKHAGTEKRQSRTNGTAGGDMVKQHVESAVNGKIRCDACPVMCYISDGRSGACDRYANVGGELIRVDPLTVIDGTLSAGGAVVPFLPGEDSEEWSGDLVYAKTPFVTAVGAGTTYPDYKPAPFIVSQKQDGVDMVTVVTEGIFSYCGAKVKIDTDRFIGPETAMVRVDGEPVGHVTTGEYGSQMLSLGGVHHLTGGSKKEGRITCETLLQLCNRARVEMQVDGGATLCLQAGHPPVINGVEESRMRVGCGSATIGMFAKQWQNMVDEVVVVDDHITGVLSEHQAGKLLDIAPTGIRIKGRRSTPGRYFQVAEPGTGWGGTNISDPLSILGAFDPKVAYPGLRLLMVSTTGEQYGYYILDDDLVPVAQSILPSAVRETVEIVAENCEPAMVSVLFMGGAGGSLRAGVTTNPVRLTRSVKEALTHVSCGGAPATVWPGGGITVMVDVTQMPSNSFGSVPTPALVAPIEFTLRLVDYEALGGHMEAVMPIEQALEQAGRRIAPLVSGAWPTAPRNFTWGH